MERSNRLAVGLEIRVQLLSALERGIKAYFAEAIHLKSQPPHGQPAAI